MFSRFVIWLERFLVGTLLRRSFRRTSLAAVSFSLRGRRVCRRRRGVSWVSGRPYGVACYGRQTVEPFSTGVGPWLALWPKPNGFSLIRCLEEFRRPRVEGPNSPKTPVLPCKWHVFARTITTTIARLDHLQNLSDRSCSSSSRSSTALHSRSRTRPLASVSLVRLDSSESVAPSRLLTFSTSLRKSRNFRITCHGRRR